MKNLPELLSDGERIVKSEPQTGASLVGDVDYTIHTLDREGLSEGDEVILEVRNVSDQCMLIGGQALELTVESGWGRLHMLRDGQTEETWLEPGVKVEVPSDNTLYWYKNVIDEDYPLIVRDHCDGFDPAHEPTLEQVVAAAATAVRNKLLPPSELDV